jgi:NAD dependent epimerase/dehydratase family enzyme
MKRAFSLGLGGRLGGGQHYQPWIHIEDEARLILWAAETESVSGPINLASPNPVTNAEFTRLLAKAVSRPAIFHAPAFVLKTALGGLGEALLCSQRAKPKVALDNGFNFAFTELGTAFQNLLSHPPAHS